MRSFVLRPTRSARHFAGRGPGHKHASAVPAAEAAAVETTLAVTQDETRFPLFRDKFPLQLLAFLRFARISDVGELAKATFDRDVAVSPQNEYEVLQLVMADLRDRLQAYSYDQVHRSPV